MGSDGKILQPGGWSPYGDTDEEIKKNMKTGYMPNAPDAMRVGPRHVTRTKKGDENLQDFLGSIGALAGQAKEAYEKKSKKWLKVRHIIAASAVTPSYIRQATVPSAGRAYHWKDGDNNNALY